VQVTANKQFSFANKQNNNFAGYGSLNNGQLNNGLSNNGLSNNAINNNVAFTSMTNVAMNNVAMTNPSNRPSLAMKNGVVKNGVLQQAPIILSDAFPPPTHNDGRNTQVCSMCHQVGRADMLGKERLTNNKNLASSIALNYSGMIQKVSNANAINGWNRVHIWVRSQSGDTVEIIVAPNWFLDFVGCKLAPNMLVKGTAFQYQDGVNRPRTGQSSALYAKNIILDGQLCRLRGDKGLPLWSN
jgi:hypothetical protein